MDNNENEQYLSIVEQYKKTFRRAFEIPLDENGDIYIKKSEHPVLYDYLMWTERMEKKRMEKKG
jgi:hypothetical protein